MTSTRAHGLTEVDTKWGRQPVPLRYRAPTSCTCAECTAAQAWYRVNGGPPHGTVERYRPTWGCRCDACRAAASADSAVKKAERVARGQADPSLIPHGLSGYVNWNCPCDVCRAANTGRYVKVADRPTGQPYQADAGTCPAT